MFASRPQKERRPTGVSRRRKRQFAFETLEDRRVMTASTPVAALQLAAGSSLALQAQSYSSDTAEGQLQILLNELYWQAQMSQSAAASTPSVSRAIPTDPLLNNQWHLINSGQAVGSPDWQPIFGVPGQDVNVAPVWNQGIFGNGVKVAVIDSGVQINHPDLAANIDQSLQYNAFSGQQDGSPASGAEGHGTAVAGLIGAVANNGIGGAGVAPGVTLVPINLGGGLGVPVVNAIRYAMQNGVDITNNSYGPPDVRLLAAPSAAELLALRDSIIFGRNGLGMIHVWASGNGAGPDFNVGFPSIGTMDSSNYDGYANSRYTIAVTGVDHDGSYNNSDGTITAYPEAGANVLVAAPTGSVALQIGLDTGIGSGIYTTDLYNLVNGRDTWGYNIPTDEDTGAEVDRDFLADTSYTSRFNGTSAAAPIATGVIALMLDVNPNLTWRDVQEILVRSARQNAEFDVPTAGNGAESQNLWYVNQQPIFRDPDPFFGGFVVDPFTDTFDPSLQPVPALQYSNGAGYTVSQGYGVYGEQIGYGHGTIDAALAVSLAQQWNLKNQNLAPEKTFTTFVVPLGDTPLNIPPGERSDDDSGNQFVPGGIGGLAGYIGYWNEYFVDDPFSGDDPPQNTRGSFLTFEVPPSNSMTMETIDVKMTITGATSEFLDHARVTLVSPSGVHSELNHYFRDPPAPSIIQTTIPGSFNGTPDSVPADGPMIWTFSTNRHWGERSDGVWEFHIENYDSDDTFGLAGLEVAWHGSPIAQNTQRIMGFVGLDENRDDVFQFSRFDETPEAWAPNTTVNLRRASDNALVKQFVVGADGNYYFDVAPDNYVITVEDPLGRAAQDDSINPTPQYMAQWTVTTADFADVTNEGFNFLLDPGPPVAQEAVLSGTVYADVNGDGAYNGDDINMPNVRVFGDVNRNGALDAGEISVVTNAAGQYSLTVPVTQASVVNVGVVRPVNWTSTNDGPGTTDSKTDGLESLFVVPGSAIGNITFAIKPPANNIGGGGASQPGILLGVVYEDANNNQSRQAGEAGVTNMTVFIDNNSNGVPDAGDTVTTTNEHGAYVFTNVPPGTRTVRIVAASPLVQTAPAPGLGRVVNLTGSSTISGASLQFGVRNTATLDFGDLPAIYGATLLAENGARHAKGAYWLGATIDAELNGHPSADADGDDLAAPFDDEDGITFDPIVPGSTARLIATASRNGGVLQGWVDWNNDGDFDDVGERIITNKALNAGANQVFFSVPAGANVNQVYARFRYGEFGINSIFGAAQLGEVEDYKLTVAVPALPQVQGLPSDADQDGDVDGNDFLAWQRNVGKTTGATQAQGDANGDGRINGSDLMSWKQSYGAIVSAAPAHAMLRSATGDFDGDGDVDGADFLALQQGVGLGFPSLGAGDGNFDGVVDTDDVAVWAQAYGEQSAASSAASLAAAGSTTGAAASMSFAAASVAGVPRTVAAESVPATVSVEIATAGPDKAVVDFGGRPFIDLVRSLTAPEKTLRERAAVLRETADAVIADATEAWDEAAHDFLHQDRAFADLIGSRRRQGLRVDGDLDLAAAVADCDEAFATLADHFDWPRG